MAPVWRDRNLVIGAAGAPPRAGVLEGEAARALLAPTGGGNEAIFLGIAGGRAVFAADVFGFDEAAASFGLGRLAELRTVAAALPAEEASLLATARGLVHWHRMHRFCGACGGPTRRATPDIRAIASTPSAGAAITRASIRR